LSKSKRRSSAHLRLLHEPSPRGSNQSFSFLSLVFSINLFVSILINFIASKKLTRNFFIIIILLSNSVVRSTHFILSLLLFYRSEKECHCGNAESGNCEGDWNGHPGDTGGLFTSVSASSPTAFASLSTLPEVSLISTRPTSRFDNKK